MCLLGVAKPSEDVVFLPARTASDPCTGEEFTVEMHHQRVDQACPGDNAGSNMKCLHKSNLEL